MPIRNVKSFRIGRLLLAKGKDKIQHGGIGNHFLSTLETIPAVRPVKEGSVTIPAIHKDKRVPCIKIFVVYKR